MKVLVGVDDSDHSELVIQYIVEATWPKVAKFVVISAAAPVFVGTAEASVPDAIAELIRQQEKYHREVADRAASRLGKAGLSVEARMVPGDPRSVLTETARREHADLIVVGSHGRTGIKKLILGSVASHVVTHAPCSVLVVRQRE